MFANALNTHGAGVLVLEGSDIAALICTEKLLSWHPNYSLLIRAQFV